MWMSAGSGASAELRRLLSTERPVLVPGAHDALSAMVIDNSGFSAVYCSGLGSALSLVGVPDVGLMTETETVFALRYIVDAVKIPVIGDGADGFGNAINTMRTVRDFIRAGVAGMHIDDQLAPSR